MIPRRQRLDAGIAYRTVPDRLRVKRRGAPSSERKRIRKRDRQTDRLTDGSQHRFVPPTVGGGIINITCMAL